MVLITDVNFAEEQSTCFTDRRQEARYACTKQCLKTPHIDTEDPDAGGGVPNLFECNERKFATPAQSDDPTAKCCHQPVAAKLATIKTGVTKSPDAIQTVSAFRFRQHVLKRHLSISSREHVIKTLIGSTCNPNQSIT